ncbi:amino acid permease, partial [bacterium]|nr:amino acid permease [bacterium]
AIGCAAVVGLYFLVNVIYLLVLPLPAIQNAPADRVATAVVEYILPGYGSTLMAIAIMISTFGCVNALVLTGARAYHAMAHDKLFFPRAAELNKANVPGHSLWMQGAWSAALVLPRTFDVATGKYGNLYGNLLDYVVSAALIFTSSVTLRFGSNPLNFSAPALAAEGPPGPPRPPPPPPAGAAERPSDEVRSISAGAMVRLA